MQQVGWLILVFPVAASLVALGAVSDCTRGCLRMIRRRIWNVRLGRLSWWAARAGLAVVRVESGVGSGMNGAGAMVGRLRGDPKVATVVVEDRDRLGQMNTELVDAASSATGGR